MTALPRKLWVQEEALARLNGGGYEALHGTGVYESFTGDRDELFAALCKAHGRLAHGIFQARDGGGRVAIGWVFEDQQPEAVIETWVTVHRCPPSIHVAYHYAEDGFVRAE